MRVLVAGGAGFVGEPPLPGARRPRPRRGLRRQPLDRESIGQRSPTSMDDPRFTSSSRTSPARRRSSPTSSSTSRRRRARSTTTGCRWRRWRPIRSGTWRLLDIARETGAHADLRLDVGGLRRPARAPATRERTGATWIPSGRAPCYDEAKRFGEALLMSMRDGSTASARRSSACSTRTARGCAWTTDGSIPELLGVRSRADPLSLHGDGSQTRSFCYVERPGRGTAARRTRSTADGEILNIGNPAEITIRELAERIVRALRHDLGAALRSPPTGRPAAPSPRHRADPGALWLAAARRPRRGPALTRSTGSPASGSSRADSAGEPVPAAMGA